MNYYNNINKGIYMKSIKLPLISGLFSSLSVLPLVLTTSCSVYTDLTKGFTPSYQKLGNKALTDEQAQKEWFDYAGKHSGFVKNEYLWCGSEAAKVKTYGDIEYLPGLSYTGEYTVYSVCVNKAEVVDASKFKFSYKITAEIEEKDEFKYFGQKSGSGITHYTVQWEANNLQYDIGHDVNPYTGNKYWLIKPAKYNNIENNWSDYLSDDETVAFNIRYLTEVYNANDIQKYGYESTEAAIMDKDHSYATELGETLNYFVCFWSYYLSNCTQA